MFPYRVINYSTEIRLIFDKGKKHVDFLVFTELIDLIICFVLILLMSFGNLHSLCTNLMRNKGELKSYLADQDTLMEYEQMRFIFQNMKVGCKGHMMTSYLLLMTNGIQALKLQ